MYIVDKIKVVVNNPAYRSVGTYIFTNFFSKGVSFLLIPLFTNPKYLTPTDNGMLSLFSSNLMLLTPFICLGMVQSATADYFKKTKAAFTAAFTTNLVFSFFLSLMTVLVLYLLRDMLQQKFDFPPSFIYIIPGLAFLVFLSEQLFALVRNRNEVKHYAFFGIGKTLIEYGVSVVLIVYFLEGWVGRVWGIAISLIVINLLGFVYYQKNNYVTFKINIQHVWEEIKFGIPVFAFQLCVFLLGSTNKIFLAIFDVDKYKLGIYAVACVFGSLIGTIAQSILLYAQPKLYQSISAGTATLSSVKKGFGSFVKMLVFISIPCILFVFLLYYTVVNQIYMAGIPFFLLVALSSFIWSLNNYIFLFLLYHKEKKKILTLALISIGCSLTVNIIMVKNFMIWGDALSGLINTLIFGVLLFIIARKVIINTLNKNLSARTSNI
jgi:O-antigen/teichoic acid export membrane protein